jgi:hypothetical protein
MNILIKNRVKIASKSCQNEGGEGRGGGGSVSEGPTSVSLVLVYMNHKIQTMGMVAYRAQGMNPCLAAFQIATWCTFGCWHLVRNLDG